MTQLEFQFFWPLTEQIPLDLDFTEPDECSRERFRREIISVLNYTGEYAVTKSPISTTFQIQTTPVSAGHWNVNGKDFQIGRGKRPSWLHRKLNKLLIDWEWVDK